MSTVKAEKRQTKKAIANQLNPVVELAKFGFVLDTLEQLREEDRKTVIDLLADWGADYEHTIKGGGLASRNPVPEVLKPFESVSAELAASAKELAIEARDKNPNATNPYPVDSALAKIWDSHFHDQQDDCKAVEIAKPDNRSDFERRQREAIRDAQARMESAIEQQRQLKIDYERLKKRLKSIKQDYDDAVEDAQNASIDLDDARDGNLPAVRTLPFKDDLDTPAVPPPVDLGADFDLRVLKRGELQKETGCDEEIGLTESQINKIKAEIEGSTIGHLEKFQRENPNWNTSIKGIGEKAIDALLDAQNEFRRKHPIPDPDSASQDDAMTVDEAGKLISQIMRKCGDVELDCVNDDGVKFATDVNGQAFQMREKIQHSGVVTDAQATAIRNWLNGIDEWWTRLDGEDELDVPDEDGE